MATKREKLAEYHDNEGALVLSRSGDAIRRGFLQEPRDLYPDLAPRSHVSYVRTPLPLSFLVLLYERTVIFIPPMSQKNLEARWGMSMERIVDFAREGIIQPIIGHAVDYSAPHFDALMETKPPSLWARGVALLEAMGMSDSLRETECPLPVAEMAALPSLRAKYRRYHPGLRGDDLVDRIKRELLTNYADLCIFGERDLADRLAQSGTAQEIADRLVLANEIRTYPVLFGMGGTANYDAGTLRGDAASHATLPTLSTGQSAFVIPASLKLLANGLGIDVATISARDVVNFHSSGDGKRLRTAMRHFESQANSAVRSDSTNEDRDQLIEVAWELERIVDAAARELSSPGFVRSAKRTERAVQAVLRVGLPAVGGLIGHLSGITAWSGMTGAAIVQLLVKQPIDSVANAALFARFNPGLANLWRIAVHRSGQ